ncbi:hypothetical protein [Microvirga vignae]|nr:hypothetical protein [Microvirga vignae]
MRPKGLLLLASFLMLPVGAIAQAVPKVGTCPSGYYTSGGACAPSSSDPRPALPKVGTCPSGYHTSGDYCLGSSSNARHAIPKTGSCPSGYYTSGDYCLSTR